MATGRAGLLQSEPTQDCAVLPAVEQGSAGKPSDLGAWPWANGARAKRCGWPRTDGRGQEMDEPGARDAGGQRRRQAGPRRNGAAGQAAWNACDLRAVARNAFRDNSIHAVCTRTITITSKQCYGTRAASPALVPRRNGTEGDSQVDASTHTHTQNHFNHVRGGSHRARSARGRPGGSSRMSKVGTSTVSEGDADAERKTRQGATRTATRREIGSTLSSLSSSTCVATKYWIVASSSGRSIG